MATLCVCEWYYVGGEWIRGDTAPECFLHATLDDLQSL